MLKILYLREQYNLDIKEKQQVDVEQLLDTLRRLKEREKDSLLYFYEIKKFLLETKDNTFVELESLLQNFIRRRVIIEDESNLDYLKELFKFDKPIEIFSTNYDTCIEQLCYRNHRLYTDGFDINWNEKNFDNFRDIKHYKLHGSVIWYQNLNTKECIKIPVDAFREEEPLKLRLIYGEGVKPLLIYPAQKAEYIEPLTDLQLMFKHRLFNGTQFIIRVGYSFRDDYIVHMLWDAARANDELNVILINPHAHELFESKLRYTDATKKAESRLKDRTICLPYPFSPIINVLKNEYLRTIDYVYTLEKNNLKAESEGAPDIKWAYMMKLCIEVEFNAKAEWILEEKIRKDWSELYGLEPYDRLIYAFKAFLHSIICKDGYEERWIKRLNKTLSTFSVDNLQIEKQDNPMSFSFRDENLNLTTSMLLESWINPTLNEKMKVLTMLTKRFENKLCKSQTDFKKLEAFRDYLVRLKKGVNWQFYEESEDDSPEIKTAKKELSSGACTVSDYGKIERLVLQIERDKLRKVFGSDKLEFKLEEGYRSVT